MGLNIKDYVRVGVYSQLEGSCVLHKGTAQFSFSLNQIPDIKNLIERVMEREYGGEGNYLRAYSIDLYDKLNDLGFRDFSHASWNIPELNNWDIDMQKEWLRGVIDSIGNVDIDGITPYIQLSSINKESLTILHDWGPFGGTIRGPYKNNHSPRYFLSWKGRDALDVLDYVDWQFHNPRNERGASLIKSIRWEDFA